MGEDSGDNVDRLATGRLAAIDSAVVRPAYDRTAHEIGIVHLGLGAFARAHLAAYTEAVLNATGGDWRIVGVSLRSDAVHQQLALQDGLYTLLEEGPGAAPAQIIGCIQKVLVAVDDPAAVIAAMQGAEVRVVSLTITEKGYCYDPSTGELDLAHPDIAWDLAHPQQPRSAVGFLVAGLAARFGSGRPAFTPLCCDNLTNNGALLRNLVLGFARELDKRSGSALAQQIAAAVEFPSTMVDRIVPAKTADDRAALRNGFGYVDEGMVKAEPFRQWVIEDRFVDGRPAWELAGALFVDDVAPFEEMKLRLLNGSHSAIAYLGCTTNLRYVHEVVGDELLRRFIVDLMTYELGPTVTPPPGIDLKVYQQALLQRFANATLGHQTQQIAMDGSQKLPLRILGSLRERLAAGQSSPRLVLVVALWIFYVSGESARRGDGLSGAIAHDPLLGDLQAIGGAAGGRADVLVDRFLQLRTVFDDELAANDRFAGALCEALHQLITEGPREVIVRLVARRADVT